MGFGQEMIIHQGKLRETIRKDGNVNQFRALCEVDGKLCVIDCKMQMAFGTFKKQLIAYGVKEALYLDMGPGWNHSWYRDEDGNAVDIFPYQHPYCTNWVVFETKPDATKVTGKYNGIDMHHRQEDLIPIIAPMHPMFK